MRNGINFSIIVGQKRLGELFEEAIDKALASEEMEVNSVKVKLTRVGKADIVPDGKNIHLVLPYHIDLYRSAGLFSIEAQGGIHLELDIAFDISEDMQVKSTTSLTKYGWIDKPKIEIGSFNIPLEKVMDMAIKHFESVITGKIDSNVRKKANLQEPLEQMLKEVHAKISEIDTKGTTANIQLEQVSLVPPVLDFSDDISIIGSISPEILISEVNDDYKYSPTKFHWADRLEAGDRQLPVYADISYDLISKIIIEETKGMEVSGKPLLISDVQIFKIGELLEVKADIIEPIKAEAVVKFKPKYVIKTGELMLDDLDVKVHPSNIIYKLTTPIVNSFIESKVNSMFPMLVNERINKEIKDKLPSEIEIPYGRAEMIHEGVVLNNIVFLEDRINAKVSMVNLDVIGTIA